MKKLMLLILLCLVHGVAAEILLEGMVEDKDIFTAGGHSFQLQYVQSTQSAIFKMDGMGGIMLPGDCETRDSIEFCYLGADYPNLDVRIESMEPDITIEREFSTDSPAINEQVTVTVTLKNEGSKRASNIKYVDSYPSSVKVSLTGSSKTWEGDLSVDEEEVFTYSFKVTEVTTFDSVATLTYRFESEEKIEKSSSETIEVQEPFSVEHTISTGAAERDEVVVYNLTLTNKDESNRLTVDALEIVLPSKITLVDASLGLQKGTDKLTYKGEIDKLDEKRFWIKVKSSKVGEFKIKTTAKLEIFRSSFTEELEKTFNVGLSYILPVLEVAESVKSSASYPVYIAIKNEGKSQIKNVSFKAESGLFDNVAGSKNMAAGSTYKVLDKTLTAPYLENEKKYNIKVSGSYRSSSGRVYTFEKSAPVTVEATPKIVEIIKEFNKDGVKPGEEIKVKVRIQNLKGKIIDDVDISDVFPKTIRSSLVGNVTSSFEELKSNQGINAYSYSVVVPKDYKEEEIEFKTLLNAKLDGELIILKDIKNIKILNDGVQNSTTEEVDSDEVVKEGEEVIKEDVVESDTTSNETSGPDGEITLSPKKKGLISRMFGWIKGLFSFGKE